jgi:ribose transport system ATP-binding protein
VAEPLLEVRDLSKTFPGLLALDRVSFTVAPGEVVGLVGQNGSGKSTLVKILAGVHEPDPGAQILVRGQDNVVLTGDAARAELHFIHQDLGLVGLLNTVENLDLGRLGGLRGLLPSRGRRERAHAKQLLARFGVSVDLDAPVAQLAAAERAVVAIARALDGWSHPRNLLVLDEPTAALHDDEVAKLFDAVRSVADQGAGVVLVSHRLDEIVEMADRVLALRNGKLVAEAKRGEYDREELIRLIAGRAVADIDDTRQPAAGRASLSVRGLRGRRVRDVSFDVAPGEIVGVAGILGSGREDVAPLLYGALPRDGGTVEVDGEELHAGSPRASVRHGVGYLPADRGRDGSVASMSAGENMTLPDLRAFRGRGGALNRGQERREVASWLGRLEVRPSDPDRRLELFSGGNQQKVLLARWLRNDPKVLLLDEPTQGVDVGAKVSIYQLMIDAAARGASVVLCSSDTEELTRLCDRVLILRDGRVAGEVERRDLTEERLVADSLRHADVRGQQ